MRRVQFRPACSVSPAELELHRAYFRDLNYTPPKAKTGKLAIVGGGASVLKHIEELQTWNGEIWAANGAARWCLEHDIDAILITASPALYPREYLVGITKAILANTCHPWTVDALKRADVNVFDPADNGPTSVTAAAVLAVEIGYRDISFFGCEGCYGATTHHYQHTPIASDIIVKIGDATFRTNVGYFLQSQVLAGAIAECPDNLKDRSGGMLSALAADPEGWDVIKLPSEMKAAA